MNMVTSSKGKPLMPALDDTDLACLIALQAEPRGVEAFPLGLLGF